VCFAIGFATPFASLRSKLRSVSDHSHETQKPASISQRKLPRVLFEGFIKCGTHKSCWVIHKVEKCRGCIERLRELGENANANLGDDDEEEPEAPTSESPSRETQRRVGWSTTMLAQVQQSAGKDSE